METVEGRRSRKKDEAILSVGACWTVSGAGDVCSRNEAAWLSPQQGSCLSIFPGLATYPGLFAPSPGAWPPHKALHISRATQ